MALIDEIKALPNEPGVYEYFNDNAKLLYVGKAKSLKKRVRSYFSFEENIAPSPKLSPRIAKMISETTHINYIVTPSEQDALILENSFIKQLKPKYNILLRDDKTYPYIYLDLSADFPRFEITRKIINGKNIKYFGPFFRGAKEILDAVYLEFKLVQKKSCIKEKRACIFHQIGRCHAPCEGKISKADYGKIIQAATKKIKQPNLLIANLSSIMQNLSENENYEEAAKIRDQIEIIGDLGIKVKIDIKKLENFEVIAINSLHSVICAIRFSVRDGKIAASNHSFILDDGVNNDFSELYKQIILDAFSKDTPISTTKIYTYDSFEDMDLVAQILQSYHDKKFTIQSPKLGDKKELCQIAFNNATLLIENQLKTSNYEFLREFRDYFGLSKIPLKVECFDNSHLFTQAKVGAFISWNTDKFDKSGYRHVHLQSTNDYDQMKEMLLHRALRFDKLSPPDLIVIDGGQALLNLADEILTSSGANIDVIAISKEKIDTKANRAKGSARDKIYTKIAKFTLSPTDKKLQFLQRLRDEAHRFAISFHQKTKRSSDIKSSKLAKIISAASIKKLLDYFGNFEAIYTADFDDIVKLTNKTVAKKIMQSKNEIS